MNNVPKYTATLTEEMTQLIDQSELIARALDAEQRPLSINLPGAVASSAQSFYDVLEDYCVEGRIFAAHKATASLTIVKSLFAAGTSIDVASPVELHNALVAGFTPDKIVATGPKSKTFLQELCEQVGATISVDSFAELERISEIARGREVSIVLRLTRSAINMPTIKKRSRFGIDEDQLQLSLEFIAERTNFRLRGLSFHLDSQSTDERYYAVQKSLDTLLDIQQRGFETATVLDIGGGYGNRYGLSPSDYDDFESELKAMVIGSRPSFTWRSRRYGLSTNGTRIFGSISGIDVPRSAVGPDDLRMLLGRASGDGISLAEQLNDNLVELWIEPGAAMTAASGVVAAEVIEVRQSDGESLVVVDAHRNQVCFEGNEHLADPIVLPLPGDVQSPPGEAYLVGHLCMETDFMTYRKISFDHMPQAGDTIVWPYMGGYYSHFSASQSIGHPLASQYTYTNDHKLKKESDDL